MTDAEGLCAAERLACEIFTRDMSAWHTVHSFRWMGQLGLPHATNQAAGKLEQAFQSAASTVKDDGVFQNLVKVVTKLFTGDWPKLADAGFLTKAMTEQSATTFESALDAATLIFAHSVFDTSALDWCRVCALAEPEDFMPHIDKKRVTLSEVQGAASFYAVGTAQVAVASMDRRANVAATERVEALPQGALLADASASVVARTPLRRGCSTTAAAYFWTTDVSSPSAGRTWSRRRI